MVGEDLLLRHRLALAVLPAAEPPVEGRDDEITEAEDREGGTKAGGVAGWV